jgi:hypothetical protein
MLGVGGTTAVTEEQKLVAASESTDDSVDRFCQGFQILAKKGLLDADTFFECFDDNILHVLFS